MAQAMATALDSKAVDRNPVLPVVAGDMTLDRVAETRNLSDDG